MENAFPWLRYCEDHWKAGKIWHNHYGNWHKHALKDAKKQDAIAAAEKAAKEKAEKEKAAAEGDVIDVDPDTDDGQDGQENTAKRPQLDGEMSMSKCCRMEEAEPAPLPRRTSTTVTARRMRVRSFKLLDCIL